MENVAGEQGLALQQLTFSIHFKVQTVIKSHSLMMGASSLAILMYLFLFLTFVKLWPIIL